MKTKYIKSLIRKDLRKRSDGYYKVLQYNNQNKKEYIIAKYDLKDNCFYLPGIEFAFPAAQFIAISIRKISPKWNI